MWKLVFTSGLDLNVEAQTLSLLRISAEGSHASRHARICAGHGPFAADEESGKRVTFLTNNFALKPDLVAQLYRQRWQVELFFKWVKQHLRIKTFLGTSENAVKTQIWIAVCTYVLIAIVKKRLKLSHSLYEILQILSLTMFETTPINQLLPNPSTNSEPPIAPIQRVLL